MKKGFLCIICLVSLLLIASQAMAITIDLNTFSGDLAYVDIASDGSSALLSENVDMWGTFFYNDSALSPSDSVSLSFSYTFAEPDAMEDGNGNDDGIAFLLYDATTGEIIDDSNGNPFHFSSFSGGSGTISWELLASDVLDCELGLEFQLFPHATDSLTTSTLQIENVRIAASIPDASSLLLLASAGATGLLSFRRRRQKTTNN